MAAVSSSTGACTPPRRAGIPPLGHDIGLATTIDESLRRFDVVWAAAGTPHDVFAIGTDELIQAIPGARVAAVS